MMFLKEGRAPGPLRTVTVVMAGVLISLGASADLGRAVAAVRLPLIYGPSQFTERRYRLGDWRLIISRNRFSANVICRMRSSNEEVVYVANALGFLFDSRLNVMDAWVRIDGGQPYRWRNDLPELARLGVAIDGKNLEAPTDGLVWIPSARLSEANRVTIQPRPDRRPRTFSLRGFAGLRDSARTIGCEPEARFIR